MSAITSRSISRRVRAVCGCSVIFRCRVTVISGDASLTRCAAPKFSTTSDGPAVLLATVLVKTEAPLTSQWTSGAFPPVDSLMLDLVSLAGGRVRQGNRTAYAGGDGVAGGWQQQPDPERVAGRIDYRVDRVDPGRKVPVDRLVKMHLPDHADLDGAVTVRRNNQIDHQGINLGDGHDWRCFINEFTGRQFHFGNDTIERTLEDLQVELRLGPVGFPPCDVEVGLGLADGDAILLDLGGVLIDIIGFRKHVASQLLAPREFALVPCHVSPNSLNLRGVGRAKAVQRKLRFLNRRVEFGDHLALFHGFSAIDEHAGQQPENRAAQLHKMAWTKQTGAGVGL